MSDLDIRVINEAAYYQKIQILKEQKAIMDAVLERVKGDTLRVHEYWTGNTGKAVEEVLTTNMNEFDYISSKLQAQIAFLERTGRRFSNTDVAINKQIDSNGQVASIGEASNQTDSNGQFVKTNETVNYNIDNTEQLTSGVETAAQQVASTVTSDDIIEELKNISAEK